jgi:hypothetical protein
MPPFPPHRVGTAVAVFNGGRKLGEHQRLRDTRMFFQYATVKGFVEPVERITGRTVRSFISGIDTEEDVSVEVFVLYPPGSDAPSRAEKSSV